MADKNNGKVIRDASYKCSTLLLHTNTFNKHSCFAWMVGWARPYLQVGRGLPAVKIYSFNSTISASIEVPFIYKKAMEIGYLNRLGPALPGLRKMTLFCFSIFGMCEWPLMTTLNPAAAGSRLSAFKS